MGCHGTLPVDCHVATPSSGSRRQVLMTSVDEEQWCEEVRSKSPASGECWRRAGVCGSEKCSGV